MNTKPARRPSRRLLTVGLSVPLLAPSLFAGNVIVVDQHGSGDYVRIQTAVDASQAGDHILVLHGDYDGFTVANKSVHISAVEGAVVQMKGTIHVLDTQSGATVTLRGFGHAWSPAPSIAESAGLNARNNLGAVRVDDCDIRGFYGFLSPLSAGALLQANANLTFNSCEVTGSFTAPGLRAESSQVATFRTNIRGGSGDAATGMELLGTNGTFYSNNGSIIGGGGEDGYCPEWGSGWEPGPGGMGYLNQGWNATRIGTLVSGGLGGAPDNSYYWCWQSDGAQGPDGTGPFTLIPEPPRNLDAPGLAQLAAGSLTLTFRGSTNDEVYIKASLGADFAIDSRLEGPALLSQPFLGIMHSTSGGQSQLGGGIPIALQSAHLGQIQPNGRLVVEVPLNPAFMGTDVKTVHLQGILLDQKGEAFTTESVVVGVLPCNETVDCNGNGIGDACETAGGMTLDCNANLVPDSCETDCNQNGIPDDCDIDSGTALDCNSNAIPDQCESDCNSNGVPDDCDISSGTSQDTDGNGFPDECQDVLRLHVDGTSPGGDGLSWASAFAEIQHALDYQSQHSLVVGEIWVARGTYYPTTTGDRNASFVVRSRARLRGGFAGFETDLSQRDLAANPTVLSGDLLNNDNGAGGGLGENSHRVVSLVPNSFDVMVDGFTIRGGTNMSHTSGSSGIGAGLLLWNAENFLVSRCTFEGNYARKGAALGFYATYTYQRSTGDLVNCVFRNNSAGISATHDFWGGGVFVNHAEAVRFINCEFSENHATRGGGAVAVHRWTSGIQFLACTMWGNTSRDGGGGIQSHELFPANGPIHVQSSIVWGNTTGNPAMPSQLYGPESDFSVKRSAIDRAVLYPGVGNINSDPLAVNAGAGDYRLSPGSPCIDAGRNGAIPDEDLCDLDQDGITAEELPLDLGGVTRRIDDPATIDTGSTSAPIVDMGAHEFDPGP